MELFIWLLAIVGIVVLFTLITKSSKTDNKETALKEMVEAKEEFEEVVADVVAELPVLNDVVVPVKKARKPRSVKPKATPVKSVKTKTAKKKTSKKKNTLKVV